MQKPETIRKEASGYQFFTKAFVCNLDKTTLCKPRILFVPFIFPHASLCPGMNEDVKARPYQYHPFQNGQKDGTGVLKNTECSCIQETASKRQPLGCCPRCRGWQDFRTPTQFAWFLPMLEPKLRVLKVPVRWFPFGVWWHEQGGWVLWKHSINDFLMSASCVDIKLT